MADDLAARRRGEPLGAQLRRRNAGGEVRRSARPELDGGQRLLVLDHLITAIGSVYAHLPAKRAAYAVDPVQALTLLRRRAPELPDAELQAEISRIVTGLRDAHTRYIGPESLHHHVAVLPFLVEQYGAAESPSYLVTKVNTAVVDDPDFGPGCVLLSWSGVPMERAVQLQADRETGGRPDSRRARALESLTSRPMAYGPPPDEDWVEIGYLTRKRRQATIRLDWRVIFPLEAQTAVTSGSRGSLRVAADPAAEAVRRGKVLQFAPDAWAADQQLRRATATGAGDVVASGMPDVLLARRLSRTLGYLRIWSFNVEDDDAFVAEVARLVAALPQERLVVDLRGNPGGLIWAAERLLQLFTDSTISPVRFSPVASPLMRQLAASPFNRMELEQWAASLEDSVSTGELYAQPLPLTDPSWCNDVGRHYPGQVVAIADPNTYSSGDIFCAGFVDHGIGPLVIANGAATGAGGANVWTSQQVRDAMTGVDDCLPPMPAGTGYTLAFRRIIRSGLNDGVPLEDLGVGGTTYSMTRRDLLEGNTDLIRYAAAQLV